MHGIKWILVVLLAASTLAIVPRNAAHAARAINADACLASVKPQANVEPPKDTDFTTVDNIVAAFNNARQKEGCNTPLSLDATAYQAASPQQQMLTLLNAERTDRGLPALQLDTTLLSQIAFNHSKELIDYNYSGHTSPLHNGFFDKLKVDPVIHWTGAAENVFPGNGSPAAQMYGYMYQDKGSGWGHRNNILSATATWVGIGFVPQGGYNTIEFLATSPDSPYTPPAAADTTPPGLDAPTITASPAGGPLTVQVTNVGDGDSPDGVGNVVGVVFYLDAAVTPSGCSTANGSCTVQTVAATQSQSDLGTWTATLPTPVGGTVGTLHAVAVDGSGNYLDCAAGAGVCRATSGDMKPPTMKPPVRSAPRHKPAPCRQPAPHHKPAPCHKPAPPRPHAFRPSPVDTPHGAGMAARSGQ